MVSLLVRQRSLSRPLDGSVEQNHNMGRGHCKMMAPRHTHTHTHTHTHSWLNPVQILIMVSTRRAQNLQSAQSPEL